jgi:hypothetical protein
MQYTTLDYVVLYRGVVGVAVFTTIVGENQSAAIMFMDEVRYESCIHVTFN